jgi:outer membrane protein assembly factor BamE (lipoprotein component of BamABCDE complex)
MPLNIHAIHKSVILGLLCASATLAMAAKGYVVDPRDERLIQPGMTKAEVQSMIGKPPREKTYAIAPGSTWVYSVRGKPHIDFISPENMVYEVDFGADGRVLRAGERDKRHE